MLLAALYVGSYYAMVQKKEVHFFLPSVKMVVSYRFGDESSEWFFAPAHALDQRLRPGAWEPEIPPQISFRSVNIL